MEGILNGTLDGPLKPNFLWGRTSGTLNETLKGILNGALNGPLERNPKRTLNGNNPKRMALADERLALATNFGLGRRILALADDFGLGLGRRTFWPWPTKPLRRPTPGVRRPRPIFVGDGQNHGNGLADERLALARRMPGLERR